MQVIKSVGIMSCAKISGAIYGCLALILMPFFVIAGLVGALGGSGADRFSGVGVSVGVIVLAVLLPILYAATGFVVGAITAWIYNLMAGWVGGVQVQLQPVSPISSSPSVGVI